MKHISHYVLRDVIRLYVKQVRACRKHRDREICESIYGDGWTVAVKDSPVCVSTQPKGKGFTFDGNWAERATYWSNTVAEANLVSLRKFNFPFELEVIHHDDLRDRTEANLILILKKIIPHREKLNP